jgi:hypothetical protein
MNFQVKEYPDAFTETVISHKNGSVFAEADYEEWIQSFDSYRDRDVAGENDSSEISGEWGNPDWSLLDDRRGQLPDFPLDVLSGEIRNFLERSAHGAGVMVDHVVVPLFSVASSLIGTSRRIAPSRSWSEPCTMWTAVVRLGGTLAYLDWAWRGGSELTEVAASYVTAAVELWREYFWPHSRAALRQVGLTDRHRDARRALRWIKGNEKTEVSVKDIRRDALGERLDAQQTLGLLGTLVSSGWLLENTPKRGPKGGKPARRWKINPSIRCNPETAETAETREGHNG